MHEIAYDTEHFTSRAVVVSVGRPGDLALPAPIGESAADHQRSAVPASPGFDSCCPPSPRVIEPWEPKVLCVSLLDRMGDVTPGGPWSTPPSNTPSTSVSVIQMLRLPRAGRGTVPEVRARTLERIAEEPGTAGMDDLGDHLRPDPGPS
ncbi:MAG: hypothetical protein R2713_18110 [Ilumatobacteraceae bacterium]